MYQDTVERLRRTQIPITQIARDTGLSRRFLHYLKAGYDKDPGVLRIQTLRNYLLQEESL